MNTETSRLTLSKVTALVRRKTRGARRRLLEKCKGATDVFWRRTVVGSATRKLGVDEVVKVTIGHGSNADVAARRAIRRLREHLPINGLDILPNHLQGLVLLGNTARDGGHEWQEYDQRAVISKESAHLPKSARQALRRTELDIRVTNDVAPIIRACRREWESWITDDVIGAYVDLAESGICIAIGAYRGEELVAGTWGLAIGRCFTGMSMFHTEPGAGTVVFAWLVNEVIEQRELVSIDAIVAAPHIAKYGVYEIPRDEFLRYLQARLSVGQSSIGESGAELPSPPG